MSYPLPAFVGGSRSTCVGGDAAVLERLRPVFSSYADTIVHCGPLGAGTTCKLINNSISIRMATLMAEAFSTAANAKVDPAARCYVLAAGAVDGRMRRVTEPWIRSRDAVA
jgi:3-hydroxyisobutyrate dehydrogenase-like beta-hydroxyacid dehydrogenase